MTVGWDLAYTVSAHYSLVLNLVWEKKGGDYLKATTILKISVNFFFFTCLCSGTVGCYILSSWITCLCSGAVGCYVLSSWTMIEICI